MEFDLPKRQIAIKEAFDAAKALVEDTGALVNDPTFLAAFEMMGGSQLPGTVKNVLPGQSMSLDQHNLGLVPQSPTSNPGSALQALVPEPSIYKLETGTGFQLRPVMQPDGDASRGVPFLEDIPLVGAVFRPAPSDDSSLQQNVIFGQTNVYPTLFDLMGLRWAQQVVDLNHAAIGPTSITHKRCHRRIIRKVIATPIHLWTQHCDIEYANH